MKIAVFISGRGSNLKALIDSAKAKAFPAEIALVISNKATAGGLAYAMEENIPHFAVSPKDYPDKETYEAALIKLLTAHKIEIVCLAGFMKLLSSYFINEFDGPILNIHPSLLPAYKGLHTHERVIVAREAYSGCTVHHVTEDMDAGPIIVQKKVKLAKNETPDTLAIKVLRQEHLAYAEAIRIVVEDLKAYTANRKTFNIKEKTMASPSPTPVKIDPEEIQRYQLTWTRFTVISKYSVIFIAFILILMALTLL
ncbi:MAG: phosphoribosylglycinamide formyltransferase [Alphaproteobacteria bacterium]|nr:phosphoribosylglycinamide formyltransferase [Alphaproteobacteria bacterium]|tara:strand:- start:620 stop:1381 length:762 start_codon:yes stop_codon:yes gene_type:complete